MSGDTPPEDPVLTAAFWDRYLADQEAGKVQPLEAYQALFPGLEHFIARLSEAHHQRRLRDPGAELLRRHQGVDGTSP